MGFNKNRQRAIAERTAGAQLVESRIREATGATASLEWGELTQSGETYHLTAIVELDEGRSARRTFGFSDEGLSDYPSGTAPQVEAVVMQAITWIKDQKR